MKKTMKAIIAGILCVMLAASGLGAAYVTPDQTASVSGEEASRLVISEPGVYTLTGNMKGSVWVDPGYGEVTLILDNAYIDGGNSAAIIGMSGDRLNILTLENSFNTLINGALENLYNQYNAAIFSYINLLLGGLGNLTMNGNNGYGAFSNQASMTVNGGNYIVNSGLDGFATGNPNSNPVDFQNGSFTVNNSPYSIQSPLVSPIIPEQFIQQTAVTPSIQSTVYTRQDDPFQGFTPVLSETPSAVSVQDNSNPFTSQGGQAVAPSPLSNQPAFPSQNSSIPSTLPQNNRMPGDRSDQTGYQNIAGILDSASEATAVAEGTTVNSAMDLAADYDNATTYDVSETSQVTISNSGTYVVTGTSEDGNITVKKGSTGVVLVLEDLDLTSTTGATLSINKQAEVQVIVSGMVTLTDNENPEDENSADADVADAFDGAAIKVKANSMVYITGDGTLNIHGNAKNGIKGGDDSSIIFGGNVKINIDAANDGINSNYDLAFLGGAFRIHAEDDGIHADHVVTIGNEDGTGPDITIENSNEGIEGTVVNLKGGKVKINSADDAINAANGDGIYEGELDYSFNMTNGELTINSQGDGIDSNGDVNLIGGSAVINSASTGGEAGIDYDGQIYVSDNFQLYNGSGLAGPDGSMAGQTGGNMSPFGGDLNSGFPQGGLQQNQNLGNQQSGFPQNQGFGGQQALNFGGHMNSQAGSPQFGPQF